MSLRSWRVRLQDMIKAIDEVSVFVNHASAEDFSTDRTAVLAALSCIHILGEASNHIPIQIKQKYPEIPWDQIRAMRNRIAHEYFEIDETIVWETCINDFPKLKPLLSKILDSAIE